MPRVKIIWTERVQLDEYDSKEIARHIEPGEFEEITPEELQQLRTNLHALPRPSYNLEPRIVMFDPEPISTRMVVIKAAVARLEKQRIEGARKRAADKKRRALTAKERRKARFEELQKEFET